VEGKSTPSVHDETTGKGSKESEQAEAFFDDGSLNGGLRHEGEIPFPGRHD